MAATVLQTSATPQSAPFARTRTARRSLLAWWHLLSLDAPSIAALWTWFIARASGIVMPPASTAAMFLAVWILYIADRLLDARAVPSDPAAAQGPASDVLGQLEERHLFHARHRRMFLCVLVSSSLALAGILPLLSWPALWLYAVVGALLAAYFALIHVAGAARRLPKELAVGAFFSAAVFIPTISRRPDLRPHLLGPALLFAVLCSLNCLRIYSWEHPRALASPARSPKGNTLASEENLPSLHAATRVALQHVPSLHIALILAALLLAVVDRSIIAAAIALSGSALFALDRRHQHLSRIDLRACADLVLAAPLLLISLGRVLH